MKGLRNLALILLASGVICVLPAWGLTQLGTPVAFPHVQLPAEPITERLFVFGGQDFHITNTMVATLLTDVVLLAMAIAAGGAARRRLKQREANPHAVDAEGDDMMVPKGWQNTFEALAIGLM